MCQVNVEIHSFVYVQRKKKKHNFLTVLKFHGAEIGALPTPAMRHVLALNRETGGWVGEGNPIHRNAPL